MRFAQFLRKTAQFGRNGVLISGGWRWQVWVGSNFQVVGGYLIFFGNIYPREKIFNATVIYDTLSNDVDLMYVYVLHHVRKMLQLNNHYIENFSKKIFNATICNMHPHIMLSFITPSTNLFRVGSYEVGGTMWPFPNPLVSLLCNINLNNRSPNQLFIVSYHIRHENIKIHTPLNFL